MKQKQSGLGQKQANKKTGTKQKVFKKASKEIRKNTEDSNELRQKVCEKSSK